MDIFIYSVSVWFFIYIYKYSDIAKLFRQYLEYKLSSTVSYALTCSFCFTFWFSLFLFIINIYPIYYVLICPVINLFLDLIYNKLKS